MAGRRVVLAGLLLGTAGVVLGPGPLAAGGIGPSERGRARAMLRNVKKELQKNYYDAAFHGLDLEARFLAAERKIETAGSLGQLMGVIAQAVLDLEDSHTWFVPPQRTVSVDYGWRIRMIGDRCVVVAIEPGSDAGARGLRAGDVILEANGVRLTRDNLWKFRYHVQTLRPQAALTVLAQSPGQSPRRVSFAARVRQQKRLLDFAEGEDFWNEVRHAENSVRTHVLVRYGHVAVWRMPAFDLEDRQLDDFMARVLKRKALVLDLRGNGGGSAETLTRLVSWLFGRAVKIGDLKGRRPLEPQVAKARGEAFAGTVVALVDSESASASEVLARVLQLEQRGLVVGERTAGAVMRSHFRAYKLGLDRVVVYGMSITDADLIMADGHSLERVGVTPDIDVPPTPEDVAAGRDPALARAVTLAGSAIDPVAAGKLFAAPRK
jgi:carboxyl-terminal processing protease